MRMAVDTTTGDKDNMPEQLILQQLAEIRQERTNIRELVHEAKEEQMRDMASYMQRNEQRTREIERDLERVKAKWTLTASAIGAVVSSVVNIAARAIQHHP